MKNVYKLSIPFNLNVPFQKFGQRCLSLRFSIHNARTFLLFGYLHSKTLFDSAVGCP